MPLISLDKPYPALVTGGGRGIGRAISLGLAELGCPVTVNYVSNAHAARSTVEAIEKAGGRAIAVQANVAKEQDVARLVGTAREMFGPTAILVNNAAIAFQRDVFENTAAEYDETFAVNVRSAFLMTQAVLPGMRDMKFGRLMFLSSNAARTGGSMSATYAASKAALEGMMRHYALRLVDLGITSNAIAPAIVETEIFDGKVLPPTDKMPMKRMGRVEEVAMIAQMIAANAYLNGQTILINAGRHMA
jgi:3-oxoacyl-[acyl-carrier protein] reductase